jgi:transcriptional/translational regulatory protein YebC/TACO1
MFDKKGSIEFDSSVDFDKLFEAAINLDAEDVTEEDDGTYRVITSVENFQAVVEGLEAEGFKSSTAEFTRIPQNNIEITDVKTATSVMRLIERLEELDDVQNVYANCDIPDEIAEQVEV